MRPPKPRCKPLQIVMILGSVRQGRMGDRVAKYALNSLKEHAKKISISTLDPLELDPNCQLNRQPMHYLKKSETVPRWMKVASKTIRKADGFMILSTEYNAFMPPALLNLMNSLPPSEFRHKPVGLITYTMGTTGAIRALTMLRAYTCELGLLCVPGYVSIPSVYEAIDQDGNCNNDLINGNTRNLVGNLMWYSHAIRNQLKCGTKPVD